MKPARAKRRLVLPFLESVKIVPALLHVNYMVRGKGYDARVRGASTSIMADRFRAGDSISEIAEDYDAKDSEVSDAIRWELIPRRTRVRMVERSVKARRL